MDECNGVFGISSCSPVGLAGRLPVQACGGGADPFRAASGGGEIHPSGLPWPRRGPGTACGCSLRLYLTVRPRTAGCGPNATETVAVGMEPVPSPSPRRVGEAAAIWHGPTFRILVALSRPEGSLTNAGSADSPGHRPLDVPALGCALRTHARGATTRTPSWPLFLSLPGGEQSHGVLRDRILRPLRRFFL